MDAKIGRLFFRTYRTQGPCPFIRFRWNRSTIDVWIARRMVELSWLHRADCGCDDCEMGRYLFDSEGR